MNNKKQIVLTGGILVVLAFFAKILNFIKELTVVNNIGFSVEYDNYLILLALTSLIIAALSACYLNVYTNYLISNKIDRSRLNDLSKSLIGLVSVLFIPFFLINGKYTYDLEWEEIILSLPFFWFFLVISLYCAQYKSNLVARKKFLNPEISFVISALASLLLLLLVFALNLKLNIISLSFILVLSGIVQVWYFRIIVKPSKSYYVFTFNNYDKDFFKEFFYLFTSSIILSSMTLVDLYFINKLEFGSVSLFINANKFIAFGIGILASTVGTMIIPYLSESYTKSTKTFKTLLFKACFGVVVFSIVLAVVSIFILPNVIPYLFLGEAISKENIVVITDLILFSLPIVGLSLLGIILSRGMVIIGKANKMITINLISISINFIADFLLIEKFGVIGIILSTIFVISWSVLIKIIIIYRVR